MMKILNAEYLAIENPNYREPPPQTIAYTKIQRSSFVFAILVATNIVGASVSGVGIRSPKLEAL